MFRFIKYHKNKFLFFILDNLGIIFLFYVGYSIYFNKLKSFSLNDLLKPTLGIVIAVNSLIFYVFDNYKPEARIFGVNSIIRTPLSVMLTTILVSGFLFMTPYRYEGGVSGRGILYLTLLMFSIYATLLRIIIFPKIRRAQTFEQWLIISASDKISSFIYDILNYKLNIKFIILTDKKTKIESENIQKTIVGWNNIENILKEDIRGIIIAMDTLPLKLEESLMKSRLRGVTIFDLTDFYEEFLQKIPVLHIKNHWFILSHGFFLLHNAAGLRIKKFLDFTFAVTLLIVSFPIMLLVAFLIALEGKKQVIYRQTRVGLGGKIFTMYKFRSMKIDSEKNGAVWAKVKDDRITRKGKFLRSTRLDELPQLMNVLKGDMSFIGPRPERPEFVHKLEKEIPFYDMRHIVKPGLTGWAQTMYPYAASIEDTREKLQYDLYYIKNHTISLDFLIMIKTMKVILLRGGQ